MLATVDADYKFIWDDIDTNVVASDAEIRNSCELKRLLQNDILHVPPPCPLLLDNEPEPYQ